MRLADAKLMAFVATNDAVRSRRFYEETLGLKFVADEEFALVFDANGTMLRIQKVDDVQPRQFTTLGWEVDDIAASMRELTAKGVAFEQFGLPGQDKTGAWTPPGTSSKIAWFQDPDGNRLSLAQF
jgi:catechol 2,3-dioxygenase-like lactoylglutathione lyase family enzyme